MQETMSIGLFRGTVKVEKHDPEWEVVAFQTIQRLKAILGETTLGIEHVGSTAIKDIVAKPIIDIVIGVKSFNHILDLNNELERNGFIFRGQDHPDQYLYICGEGDFLTHHIHAVLFNSEAWRNYINFRDYLNTHKDDALTYSRLKEKLAIKYKDDRKTYTLSKSDFVNEIIHKAQIWRNKTISLITNNKV